MDSFVVLGRAGFRQNWSHQLQGKISRNLVILIQLLCYILTPNLTTLKVGKKMHLFRENWDFSTWLDIILLIKARGIIERQLPFCKCPYFLLREKCSRRRPKLWYVHNSGRTYYISTVESNFFIKIRLAKLHCPKGFCGVPRPATSSSGLWPRRWAEDPLLVGQVDTCLRH